MLQKIRLILIGVVVIVLFSLLLFSDPVGSLLMSTITHTDNTLEKSFTSLELSQKRSQNKKDSKKFDPFREELLDLIQGSKTKNQQCSPHPHFVFIKTHKTGSSSIQVIMKRYSEKLGLKKAPPVPLPLLGGYPGRIKQTLMRIEDLENGKLRVPTKEDDFIIREHFRFNHEELKMIMPKDTKYFTILRKPWNNFQSAFHFFHTFRDLNNAKKPSCNKYPYFHIAQGHALSLPEYLDVVFDRLSGSIPWFFRSKNFQSFDLGLDALLENEREIKQAIHQLDSQLDLVMIAEYMDESLVLLKNLLCMTWSDFAVHSRTNAMSYPKLTLSDDNPVMKKFANFYKLDIALYEHFNKSLWKKVDEYGREKMLQDVEQLKKHRGKRKSWGADQAENEELEGKSKTSPQDLSGFYEEHRKFTESQKPFWQEKRSIKFYKNSLRYFHDKNMTDLLTKKIFQFSKDLTEEESREFSKHMVQNSGGCPLMGVSF